MLIQNEYASGKGSLLRRYQDLIVGDDSLLFLILYEAVTLLFTRIPGALGIALRKVFYPMLLGHVGKGVVFGVDVFLRHPKKIRIGDGAIIDDGALLDAKGSGNRGITIGDGCYVGRGTVLSCKEGDIELGDRANLSTYCNISSNSRIVIGPKTLIGPHCSLFATTHNFDDPATPILDQGWSSKGITVGADCWLGHAVTVTDGVTVGVGAVVGAGAVVTQDVPPGMVAAGVPARTIKKRGE